MEDQSKYHHHPECQVPDPSASQRGKVAGGLLVVIIGCFFLARELGVDLPGWLFTWETLIMSLGLVFGIKSKFRGFAWLAMILIGSAFLLSDLYPEFFSKPIMWPVFLIIFGLFMIFKPRRHHNHPHFVKKWKEGRDEFKARRYDHAAYDWHQEKDAEHEQRLEVTTFMGGVKKRVVCKDFKGGEVTTVFSGVEIDLSQADFENNVSLEVTTVFGGTKLILPAHWKIQSELTSVMGSVEDKRPVQTNLAEENVKTLILRGTVFMGGIEIKSF